jgi:hypothetical protein
LEHRRRTDRDLSLRGALAALNDTLPDLDWLRIVEGKRARSC